MEPKGFQRKLTAILSADVAGYSRLMQDDEAATVRTLEDYKQILSALIRQHRGRVVDSPGDNLLAEFASVVDAVQCAVAVQKELQARNSNLPEHRRMQFRIGVNLGDVIQEGERIYGDGVNIAARLESISDPGGICVSKTAFDHIENKLPLGYAFIGEQTVKNIAKPVGAYKVLMEPRVVDSISREARSLSAGFWKITFACAALLAVLTGAVLMWKWTDIRTTTPQPESNTRQAVSASPAKTSIAVLPFQNMMGDPQQDYLCDGIAEQLITGLSQTPDIYVIARTSSFAYRGKSINAQQIAAELGVRYLIEGSVQRDADRIRIHIQLIDGGNGEHVWAERYDRKVDDLFVLQDQIAMEVMSAVNVKFGGFVAASLKYYRPNSIKAYEYYLKGLYYHLGRKKDDVPAARQMLEEAIRSDPNYGVAYRWLGFVCLDEINFKLTRSVDKTMEQAEQLAQKSWQVDPDRPPYGLLSAISRTKKDFDNAVQYAEKGLESDPNNGGAHFTLGIAYMLAGKYEEAIKPLQTALRMVPVRPPNYLTNLARTYLGDKQYDKAIAVFAETLERYPDFPGCWGGLTVAYEESGNHPKALWAAENLVRTNPKYSVTAEESGWPIKDQDFKKRYFDAQRKAGLK